jgi:D-tyrosyl-tRNA(Tyr) deacylase
MLSEAEEKTTEQIKEILVDWKGCGKSEQRQEIVKIIKQTGLKYKRTSEIEKA